jgi:hypothetical protein
MRQLQRSVLVLALIASAAPASGQEAVRDQSVSIGAAVKAVRLNQIPPAGPQRTRPGSMSSSWQRRIARAALFGVLGSTAGYYVGGALTRHSGEPGWGPLLGCPSAHSLGL